MHKIDFRINLNPSWLTQNWSTSGDEFQAPRLEDATLKFLKRIEAEPAQK
jgi:hypothetical protein